MDSLPTVRSVSWPAVFPSVLLARTLRISFRLSVLGAAFGGYVLMVLGGWFIGAVVFAGSEDPLIEAWRRPLVAEDGGVLRPAHPVELRSGRTGNPLPGGARDVRTTHSLPEPLGGAWSPSYPGTLMQRAIYAPVEGWWHLTGPAVRLFDPRLSFTAVAYLLAISGWNVLVWGLFGGAIARIAALELTQHKSITATDGLGHAIRHFPAHVLAPCLAGAAILLLAMPLIVAGALMRLDFVAWVAGMLWLAVLLVGLLLAVLAIGALVGWPLMWAAVAADRSDPFDAVSRAYAYVYQRPLHLVAYVVLAAVLVIIGAAIFYLFAGASVGLADWAIAWGSGAEVLAALQGAAPGLQEALLQGAATGRRFWIHVVSALTAAYPIGFLFTAAVGVYLLLRWRVDAAQIDEVAEDEPEPLAGLPVLEPHPSGVPAVEPRPSDPAQAARS